MLTAGGSPKRLIATCSRGLETVVAEELRDGGVGGIEVGRGHVAFFGKLEDVVAANLWLRAAVRIILPLKRCQAADRRALYQLAAGIEWERVVAPGSSVAVEVAGASQEFANPKFAALVVKDAVVDRLRRLRGERPDVDRADPDVRIHVHLGDRETSIGLDTTGEPLSHRGYRPRGGPAPLSEALAAGILRLAGYDGELPLYDPMCGTGTVAIEAALIATRTAPGLRRAFAFQRWPTHDPRLEAEVRRRARKRGRPAPYPIFASDSDAKAVSVTRRNATEAGVGRWIQAERCALGDIEPLAPGSLLVTNPPYGKRMSKVDELRDFYRGIGDVLKARASGSTAWLLVGSSELLKSVGLKTSRRIQVFNGPIECRLVRYDLYEGSRKVRRGE